MSDELQNMGYFIPGNAIYNRGYWLYPIAVPNRKQFCEFMNKQKFYCSYNSSQLWYVSMPEHLKSKYGEDMVIKNFYTKHCVYVPIKSNLSESRKRITATDFLDACKHYMDYTREVIV